MSRQQHVWMAISILAVVTGGCGSAAQSSTAPAATTAPPTTPTASPPPTASTLTTRPGGPSPAGRSATGLPARLPRNNSEYSQLLIDAWTRGDRAAAARVATPAAVAATFAHAPVRGLVNYSCEDGSPVICGYIGEKDVRVELSLDEGKVSRGADQAITRVRLAMP